MNAEIKKVVDRVKTAQGKLQNLLKSQAWVEDARRYAERQGKEVRKLLAADVGKVKTFLERERKELERFQKQVPGELKKFRNFLNGQRKEFERLLTGFRKRTSGAKSSKKSYKTSPGGKKKQRVNSRKSTSDAAAGT